MSDNPYERDIPDEPAEPVNDDGATTRRSTAGAPWAQRLDPAPPRDDAPWLTGGTRAPSSPWPGGGTSPAADDAAAHGDAEATGSEGDATRTAPTPAEAADGEHRDAAPAPADGSTAIGVERTQVLRTHEAERPVPRSGLAEHRSAGYLTGERTPEPEPEPEPETTAATPGPAPWLTGAAATTPAPAPATREERPAEERPPRPERDVLLEGTTAHTRPPRRTKAHVLTILLTLLLTPVAWYLLADAGARLTLPARSPWDTGNLNVAALLELAGGLLVLVVVLLAARWSSVGAIVTGALVIVLGVPFVAVPAWTQDVLEPVESWLAGLGDFGDNVAHHLVASGSTGRLVAVGVALVLVGVVSHGARRQGRREVRPAVEA